MLCKNKRCGRDIQNDAKYCPYCGRLQTDKHRMRRSNGEGSIFQMPDKRWKAEIIVAYEIDGISGKLRKVRRTKIAKTRAELADMLPAWKAACIAEYQAIMAEEQAATEQAAAEPQPSRPTLADCWDIFIRSRAYESLGKSQQQKLGYAWKKLQSLHNMPIEDITLDDMQELIHEKAPTYYPAKDMRTVLSHSFVVAIRRDLVAANRTEYLELPPLNASKRKPFTNDDISAFWRDWEANHSEFVGYILVMIYAGLRPGELRALEINNIHLDKQYMIGGSKTSAGRDRTIPIADRIVPVLHALTAGRTGQLITMNDDRFYSRYWDTIDRLHVSRLEPYSCRHTFFTRLAEADVQPGVITSAGGHESYSTTMTYTHVRLDKLLDAVNRIDPDADKGTA